MAENYTVIVRGEYNAFIELHNEEKYRVDVRFDPKWTKEEQDQFIAHTANEAYANMSDINLIQPTAADMVAPEKPSWWAKVFGSAT